MISLADLRARNVVPIWQEAIAVVQELLYTVVATHGSADHLPDLEHVALIANGDVVALPGSPASEHPVRHLAILLKLLLEDVVAPPELRTFIDANLTDPPQLETVEEFSRQLAFFERPGRRSDVERLVGRAMTADAQTRAEEELRRLKERAVEASELASFKPEEDEVPQRRLGVPVPRQALAAVAVLVVAVLAGAGWWLLSSRGAARAQASSAPAPRQTQPPATVKVPQPSDASAPKKTASQNAAAPAPSSSSKTSAAQTVPPAGAATSRAAAPTPAPVAADEPRFSSLFHRTTSSLARAVQYAINKVTGGGGHVETAKAPPVGEGVDDVKAKRPTARTAKRAARTPSPPAAAAGSSTAVPESPQIETTTSPIPESDSASSFGDIELRSLVYSVTDSDVLPAVLVRPVLPATPPPDVPPSQIGTLELVVDENGDVERVRLVSPSNRFHERMLVAHAKTWKFRPAIKDGRPVKFRTRVRLTI